MNNGKNLSIFKLDINDQIQEIDGAMAQEGMPLTDEIKENIRKCLSGESTTEIECQKVIDRFNKIYG